MRPEILNNLFQNMDNIQGVGQKTFKNLMNLFPSPYIVNLLWHLPTSVINRKFAKSVDEAYDYSILKLRVIGHERTKQTYKVTCFDDFDNEIILTFFHGKPEFLKVLLPIDEIRFVSGKIETFKGIKQISHPDFITKKLEEIPTYDVVYPLTAGISKKMIRNMINDAMSVTPKFEEWLDAELLKSQKWADFNSSLSKVHNPTKIDDVSHFTKERRRLAYDELLSNQLALAILRKEGKYLKGVSFKDASQLQEKAKNMLSFKLTNAQERAIAEINKDMQSDNRMLRLLQGDVGSGKTLVAFFASLTAIFNGYQVAFMAPTDILAKQHFNSLLQMCEKLGIKSTLLTGSLKTKEKNEALKDISEGNSGIIVGTHAIFQEKVEFKNLGFVVVDEQHRFGVHQRLKLSSKGKMVDMLVMSATPIPRTLALTIYGDMDLSILDEKPLGRKDILTCAMNVNKINDVVEGLKRAISDDKQIYWVCPLVEETLKSDLKAVTERFENLKSIFGDKVGMVHGKLKPEEKDKAINDFASGKTKILVATTVIEVGIDVKSATIMIIEHSERFGLSQLHQLRGRVGRNDEDSSCVLLYADNLTDVAKQRINVLRNTNDGFKIAEEDLKIRGMGDVLGTKQSGIPEFKLADLSLDNDLLKIASQDARLIIKNDPELKSIRGQNLRTLLYLFNQDQAISNLRSG